MPATNSPLYNTKGARQKTPGSEKVRTPTQHKKILEFYTERLCGTRREQRVKFYLTLAGLCGRAQRAVCAVRPRGGVQERAGPLRGPSERRCSGKSGALSKKCSGKSGALSKKGVGAVRRRGGLRRRQRQRERILLGRLTGELERGARSVHEVVFSTERGPLEERGGRGPSARRSSAAAAAAGKNPLGETERGAFLLKRGLRWQQGPQGRRHHLH